MKTKTLLMILLVVLALSVKAQNQPARVPARNIPATIAQPNGDSITIRLVGDEWMHFYMTLDGWQLVQNNKGYYCYALPVKGVNKGLRASRRKAHDADKRSRCEVRWLRRHGVNVNP